MAASSGAGPAFFRPTAARALLLGLKAFGRIEAERIGTNGKRDTATR